VCLGGVARPYQKPSTHAEPDQEEEGQGGDQPPRREGQAAGRLDDAEEWHARSLAPRIGLDRPFPRVTAALVLGQVHVAMWQDRPCLVAPSSPRAMAPRTVRSWTPGVVTPRIPLVHDAGRIGESG